MDITVYSAPDDIFNLINLIYLKIRLNWLTYLFKIKPKKNWTSTYSLSRNYSTFKL